MLEFTCPNCGKRVQGDDSSAGQQVQCAACHGTILAPGPAAKVSAITAEGPRTVTGDVGFREGEPLRFPEPRGVDLAPPRSLLRWKPLLIVVAIGLTVAGLVTPFILKMRQTAARTASTNNLKAIGLAAHSFHELTRRLPYNGITEPVKIGAVQYVGPQPGTANFESGSVFFQISAFMPQPMFDAIDKGGAIPGVSAWMCPGRGRHSTWESGGSSGTLTAKGGVGANMTSGPWTDYVINPYLNANVDFGEIAAGQVNAPNNKRTLVSITDGTSNTIFFGHGQIAQADYGSTSAVPGYLDSAVHGGTAATAANPNAKAIVFARDPAASRSVTATNRGWGGPFAEGALMCMCDATVRLFPYSLPAGSIANGCAGGAACMGGGETLATYLTPSGGDGPCGGPDV